MTLEELTAKLEAIDKELLPLFAKNGQAESNSGTTPAVWMPCRENGAVPC